jgi:hypothetical protein
MSTPQQTGPFINSVYLFSDSFCECEILHEDGSTTKIKIMGSGLTGLSLDDRYAKIKDRAARHIAATSTILISGAVKVSLMYRGNIYSAREVMYRECDSDECPWVKALVGTEALNKILEHDSACVIHSIEDEARGLDARVGFFLPVDTIENDADPILISNLSAKYDQEYEFKSVFEQTEK